MKPQFVMSEEYRSVALTQRIMRRVYWQWFYRKMAPTLGVQLGTLALLGLGIHEFISVRFVLANALNVAGDFDSLTRFALSAVQNTGVVTHLLSGALLLLGIMLLRDASRAWKAFRSSSVNAALKLIRPTV